MDIDIYLTAVKYGSGDFRFPSLPGEIQAKGKANYRTYDIIAIGQVMMPSGNKADQYSWDAWFWGKEHRSSMWNRKWRSPKSCIERLDKWKRDGTVLRLLVTNTPINKDVTISDFTYKYVGLDVKYQITLYGYTALKMYTTTEMGTTSYEAATTVRPDSTTQQVPKAGSRVTLKDGMSLWALAAQAYGDGDRWVDIYLANREVIEGASGGGGSGYGLRVSAGTQLVIP